MKLKFNPKKIANNIREIIFGLEDSLVSTLGAVTGIAAGAQSTYVVILAGLTLIAVEASSMAAGSYLSSKSYAQAQKSQGRKNEDCGHVFVHPLQAAMVMGIFYFIGGFVPLTPYFFLPVKDSYLPSILATAVVLYLIGVWSAKYTKRSRTKSGLEMAGISLAAALLGYLIGRLVSYYFGVDLP